VVSPGEHKTKELNAKNRIAAIVKFLI